MIIFHTTVPDNLDETQNQGIAYWDQDGDGVVDTNRTVTTDDPVTTPADDPTSVKKPISVPTLSEWGRIALAGMLMLSAFALLYRRQEEV